MQNETKTKSWRTTTAAWATLIGIALGVISAFLDDDPTTKADLPGLLQAAAALGIGGGMFSGLSAAKDDKAG